MPVGLIDAEFVVAASGEYVDSAERAAVEAVLSRAVVTEVDLEGACCTAARRNAIRSSPLSPLTVRVSFETEADVAAAAGRR
jgi:hypothetical protein